MHISIVRLTLVVALYLLGSAQAKAVFAHYMIGNVTEDHAHQDVDNAIAIGLDGFALNIGDPTQALVPTTLGYLFEYVAGKNFKLFISMDVSASAAACQAGSASCNGPNDYDAILANYLGNSAYYLGPNGMPMISTYSAGGFGNDTWNAWKQHFASDMYFIPMFDNTSGYYQSATGWWSYWGDLVEGLFSWESAWPLVNSTDLSSIGDLSYDLPVMNGALAHQKGYMIALSTLQYKDSYDTNLYRAGDLNLPVRMMNILNTSSQPDFVEIITWNDGPESHYIGNIWPEQNADPQATIYATQAAYPHTAWQPLITSFMQAWKSDGTIYSMSPPSNMPAVGAMWYNTILQNASCSNAAKPQGWGMGTDSLNWAVVIPAGSKGMQVRAISNNVALQTAPLVAGLNFGSPIGVQPGVQMLQLLDGGGNIIMLSTSGKCVSSGCPDGIFNMNYQVLGLAQGTRAGGGCS